MYDDSNDEIIIPDEEGFKPNEREKWFKESEYIKQVEIDNEGTYIYPSEISNNINERIITLSFKAAIEINSDVFYNKTVLDIHSGIGVNSLLAAKAGAKIVYSIEPNKTLAKYAREIIKDNFYDNIIQVISDDIYNFYLPNNDKVDIIICNWMGFFLLQSSLIKKVIYARDNFLIEKNGIILPDKATLYISALEDQKFKEEKFSLWNNVYGVNMECIKNISYASPLIDSFNKDSIISTICPIYNIDLYTITEKDLNFSNEYELIFIKNDYMSGLASWFDVEFFNVPNQIKFTTSPYNQLTKWKHTIFYKNDDVNVQKGDVLKGSFCCLVDEKTNEEMSSLNIKISFHFNRKENNNEDNDSSNGIQLYKISF